MNFRHPTGSDAPALRAVHEARRETDGVIVGLGFEAYPSLKEIREGLDKHDPKEIVIAELNGDVVGYGHTKYWWDENDGRRCYLLLGWVKPDFRNRGIGTELITRLEARCREKASLEGFVGNADFGANASSTETSAQELLLNNGYRVLYTAIEMVLSPEVKIEPTKMPAGYELKPVLEEHKRQIWQMIGDAYFDTSEDGHGAQVASENDYQSYFESPNADPSLWFVAWRGSRVAGAVLTRIKDDIATVYEVSVGHYHRRLGLSRALLTEALQELQSRRPKSIRVATKKEFPTQAWRLYESVGFRTVKEFPRWRKPLR